MEDAVPNGFLRVTNLAQEILKSVIEPGDILVDATAGTGEDTLFLAALAGEMGHVYTFDIQEEALVLTQEKLERSNLKKRVTLIKESHENMEKVLKKKGIKSESIKGMTFNLGYLPGGDHEIVTEAVTTIEALKGSLELLSPGGLITICLYHGHPKGAYEAKKVLEWCENLESIYGAHHFQTINRKTPPTLVIIQKRR